MKNYKKSSLQNFIKSLNKMRLKRKHLTFNLSELGIKDYKRLGAIPYLSKDKKSGYCITKQKEIISLFSIVKGRGNKIIKSAIKNGGNNLNCFDGYLSQFYKKNGFTEIKRIKNYNGADFPDVVYLQYKKGVK